MVPLKIQSDFRRWHVTKKRTVDSRKGATMQFMYAAGPAMVFAVTLFIRPHTTTQDSETCPYSHEGPIPVSADSIAYLPVGATLTELLRMCPAAYDTSYATAEFHRYPAIAFPFEGMVAVAVQTEAALLLDWPPSYWTLNGARGELPGGVSFRTTWGEMEEHYGMAYGTTEFGPVFASFCNAPWLMVIVDANPRLVGSIEVTGDLSTVPKQSAIVGVLVGPAPFLQVINRCSSRVPSNQRMKLTNAAGAVD